MNWRATAALIALATLPGVAQAQIVNGSFESGFTSWSLAGDDQIQGSSIGSGPTDGVNQALLASATDGSVNPAVTPGTGVAESQVNSLLGLGASALTNFSGSNVVLSSAVAQSVTLTAGQKVSFDWDFLTNQTYNDGTSDSIAPSQSNNDFSFLTLTPSGHPSSAQISLLANTFYGFVANSALPGGFGTGFTITNPNDPFISETGYHTYSFTVATSGTYTLGVGVAHVVASGASDDGVNSALLVDNFSVSAVPEPLPMLTLGVLSLGLFARIRGNK